MSKPDLPFRRNQTWLSDELGFYANTIIAAITDGREGVGMTREMIVENTLREVWTTKFPHLPEAWEEFKKAKQEYGKGLRKVEDKAAKDCQPL